MLDISHDGIISMSRGDTIKMTLFINDGTEIHPTRYELSEKDRIYVGICEPNQLFENAIVRQTYTSDDWELSEDGDLIVKISPEETEHLVDGLYYYTIKMVTTEDDGEQTVQTVVPKTKLYIED